MIDALLKSARTSGIAGGIALVLASTLPAQSAEVVAATPPPHRLALVVGIGTYPGDTPLDLPGPANDLALVRRLLIERFGFAANDVATLLDGEATHAAIVETFRSHLIAKARPGTEVVFWYCGHGSRIVDRSGREPDQLDNTLVAHDSRVRSPDGGYDVSDDELHTLLRQLAAITDRIVVVTDSCHSGSSFRSGGDAEARPGLRCTNAGTAALDLELVAPLWKDTPILDDDSELRTPIDDRFVHVAACARWQSATEIRVEGRSYGLLTWYLVRALEQAKPGDTWRQVVEQAQLFVQDKYAAQTPTCDGAADREVLGGRFVAPPRGIPAQLAGVDARGVDLVLEAGELSGLVVGSELVVHPFRGDEVLGRARIARLLPDGMTAHATWSGDAPTIERGKPLRAVEEGRPAQAPRLPVAVTEVGLVGKLGLEPWFLEVEPAAAEFVLAPADDVVGYTLRSVEGVPIWPTPAGPPKGVEVTARSVAANAVRFRSLTRLPLQPGVFSIAARFVPPTQADDADGRFGGRDAAVAQASAQSNQWHVELPEEERQGESFRAVLEVTNQGNSPVHVVVLSLEELGCRRNAIWGYLGEDATILRPGEPKRVRLSLTRPQGWPLARPMRDRYVVLAIPEPLEVRRLSAWSDDVLRAEVKPLPWVIEAAYATPRDRTRGRTPGDAPRQWGVTWVDLQVR